MNSFLGRAITAGGLLWALAAAPGALQAQTAIVEGSLSAFDVVNDSGQDTHGFEIRLEGAFQSDLYYTMFGQRYGNAHVVADLTGVSVRYESPYDANTHRYTVTTPQHVPGSPFSWNDCYSAGQRYSVSGCEHFGQSLRTTANITKASGYWLVEDSANPGTLIRLTPAAVIPMATWTIGAPVTAAPVVIAQVVAPPPPPAQYGDAQWIKIFKTELPRQVTGDELSSDNPSVVPEDPTQVEVSWDILQAAPPGISGGNGNRNRGSKSNGGGISKTTRSVVRRYELYKYTGVYDALTHEAICADGNLCNAPSAGELGGPVSSQNTAANVTPDVVVVNLTGNGTITATNGINCGSNCAGFAPAGSSVTLTATPGTMVFGGWSGACTGTALTCSVTVNGVTTVNAVFNPPPNSTVTVVVSGSGEVRSSVGAIRCPGVCTMTLPTGTAVTLTAKGIKDTFAGWAGACSGTSLTCTLTLAGDTNVSANFTPPAGGSGGGGGGGGGGTTTTTFRLSISINGSGTVTANPAAQDYATGTVVTLTASPKTGSPWVGWSGACTGTSTSCTLTMDANKSVTANFR